MTDSNGPFQPSSVASDLAEFHTVVPTLEAWAQQLRLLKVNTTCSGFFVYQKKATTLATSLWKVMFLLFYLVYVFV